MTRAELERDARRLRLHRFFLLPVVIVGIAAVLVVMAVGLATGNIGMLAEALGMAVLLLLLVEWGRQDVARLLRRLEA